MWAFVGKNVLAMNCMLVQAFVGVAFVGKNILAMNCMLVQAFAGVGIWYIFCTLRSL